MIEAQRQDTYRCNELVEILFVKTFEGILDFVETVFRLYKF